MSNTQRILEFDVKKQRLFKNAECSFSGLIAGSIGYLRVKFHLSEEWDDCSVKIVRFWIGEDLAEEHAYALDENDGYPIPDDIASHRRFGVSLLGARPGFKIETNKSIVVQKEVT